MSKKIEVKAKNKAGEDVVVYVVSPDDKAHREAAKVSNRVFSDAIKNNAVLRKRLDDYMKEQGVWSDEQQKELEVVQNRIQNNIKKLSDKNSKLTLDQGKDLAVEIRKDRVIQNRMLSVRSGLDEYTAEGQSENAKFDSLVVSCVLDENGEKIFSSIEDYKERGDEPFAIEAASKLSSMVYGLDSSWEQKLPENKFLKQFGFVDEELRLVDEKGRYVTTDGKLINKDGRYIDEEGNFVNADGDKVDEDGFTFVDFSHFEEKKKTKSKKE